MAFYIFERIFHFFDQIAQWEKLYYYIDKYVIHNPFGMLLILLMIISFVLGIMNLGVSADKPKVKYRYRLVSFILYSIALVLLYIVIKNGDGSGVRVFSWSLYITEDNLGYHESMVLTTLTHLILFVPFGYWLTLVLKKIWFLSPIITCLVAVTLETLQLVLNRGYFAKVDILAYIVGGCLGFVIALLVKLEGYVFGKMKREQEK